MRPFRSLSVAGCVILFLHAAGAAAQAGRELIEAARSGNLAAASRLLQEGAGADAAVIRAQGAASGDLSEHGPRDAGRRGGETALAAAARSGSVEIARLLLSAGADVNRAGALADLPLSIAVARGDAPLAALLLRAGSRTDVRDPAGYLPLSRAVEAGDTALARHLLEAGADPDARQRDGTTPLADAVRLGRLDLVRLLLDAGARVDAGDREGKAPLYRAIVLRREEIALLLLERGADPRRRVDGEDMAGIAIWAGQTRILRRIEAALR